MRLAVFTFLALVMMSVIQPSDKRNHSSALAASLSEFFGIQNAEAQQRQRKSLFKVLRERVEKRRAKTKQRRNQVRENIRRNNTDRKKTAKRPVAPAARQAVTKRKKTTKRSSATKPQKKRNARQQVVQKPVVAVEKKTDAGKILVVGDFMAGAIARGLESQYVENADILIVNTSKPDSGIVRDDVLDWPETLPKLIEEHKPVAVLALIGMNDRQQMRLSGGRVEKLSEEWTAAYRERITKIASATEDTNIPFLWVGLPPVSSNRMNTDYLAFNELYRSITEAKNGTFVDVWDGFTNADGKFVSAGPDVNGNIVRLRGSKGITMLNAGRRKLAFFADKELRRLGIINDSAVSRLAGLGEFDNLGAGQTIPDYDPVGSRKTVVISLGAPALDGGRELEGAGGFLQTEDGKDSVSHELVARGVTQAPRPGRIDAGWGIPTQVETVETTPVPNAGAGAAASTGNTQNNASASAASASQSRPPVSGATSQPVSRTTSPPASAGATPSQ